MGNKYQKMGNTSGESVNVSWSLARYRLHSRFIAYSSVVREQYNVCFIIQASAISELFIICIIKDKSKKTLSFEAVS